MADRRPRATDASARWRHPFWVDTSLYQTRKKPFRRARSMELSGAAHQPRALGTANPARILACLSLLRQLRARARPSRPTTFSDNMCALDDDASLDVTGYPGSGGHEQDTRINSRTHGYVLCATFDSHVLAMACTSRVSGEVHDLYAPCARSCPRSACHAFTRRQAVSGVALLATRYLGTMPGLG